MMKKQADLTTFSLTQYLEADYWKFYSEDIVLKEAIDTGDLKKVSDWVYQTLITNGNWGIEEAYSIIHDKDSRQVWNEDIMDMVIEVKDPHIHMSVKFEKGKNVTATIDRIAEIIGVEPQYIEKPKAGRYSWDNQLAYLIHAKDLDKYSYNPSDVYTFQGESYMSIYTNSIERWKRGGIKKANKQAVEDVDWLENKILRGELVRSQIFLTDEYYAIYALNKHRIDDAFESYGQRKMYKALKKLENGEFKTLVYYLMGDAGSGKTSFAKDLIKDLIDNAKKEFNEDWQVCQTASTNPVDDYQGEEILLMDDVRGSSMRADDWLKLLDPWNVSPSSARYRNKIVTARVIIITATLHPAEFFYYAKSVGGGTAQSEAIDQFLRRLMGVLHIIDFNKIKVLRSIEGDTHKPLLVGHDCYNREITTLAKYSLEEQKALSSKSRDEIIEELSDEVIANNKLNPTN